MGVGNKCLIDNALNVMGYLSFTRNSAVYTRDSCDPSLVRHNFCKANTAKILYFNRIDCCWLYTLFK